MTFAVPADFEERRRRDHRRFFCPSGHGQSFLQESDIQRAEKAAARAQELLEMERRRRESLQKNLDHTEYRRRAEAAAKTRLKNRAAAGLCPCCNRHFTNLERHMDTKHPEVKVRAKGGTDGQS